MRASVSSMIGVVSEAGLSGLPGRDSVISRKKDAKMSASSISIDLRNPFCGPLIQVNPRSSASVENGPARVFGVFLPINRSQVFKSIVGSIAVDMVNLVWNCSVSNYVRSAMRVNQFLTDHAVQVARGGVNKGKGLVAGVHLVPCLRSRNRVFVVAGAEKSSIALKPKKFSSFRIVSKQLAKIFRRDVWSFSHFGLLIRSFWSGLVEAVATPPSPHTLAHKYGASQ